MPQGLNWADVLSGDPVFVVLTKRNRLQVLVQPGRKQLRRRSRRGWKVAAAIEAPGGEGPVPPELRAALMEELAVLIERKGKRAGPKTARHKPKG